MRATIRELLSRLWWVAVERGWWRLASWLPMPITHAGVHVAV